MSKWHWLESADEGTILACYGNEVVFRYHYREGELTMVRLYPGSDFILGGIGNITGWLLYWGRFNGHRMIADPEWSWCETSDGLKLTFAAIDRKERDCSYHTELEVRLDEQHNTYIFDVETKLRVQEGKYLEWGPYTDIYEGLEFLNFYPSGIFNDRGAGPVTDLGRPNSHSWLNQERYRGWIYQNRDREWIRLPLNHLVSSPSYACKTCKNGIWMLEGEADRIPTVQILGDTWKRTHVGLCHWLYDMHFNYLPEVNPLSAGTELAAKFRVYNTSTADAANAACQARTLPIPDAERLATDFPASSGCGLDLFTEGIHHGHYDPHRYWRPFIDDPVGDVTPFEDDSFVLGAECLQKYRTPAVEGVSFSWRPSVAGRSCGCVSVHAEHPEKCGWMLTTSPYVPGYPYRLEALVRTCGVEGRGVILGLRPWSETDFHWSEVPVKGTNDWTPIAIELPPLKNHIIESGRFRFYYNFVDIKLMLDGEGQAEITQVRYKSQVS